MSQEQRKISFLGLPTELRILIYENVIVTTPHPEAPQPEHFAKQLVWGEDFSIYIKGWRAGSALPDTANIALVCRTTWHEALPVFYNQRIICHEQAMPHIKPRDVEGHDDQWRNFTTPSPSAWVPLSQAFALPHLRRFKLTMQTEPAPDSVWLKCEAEFWAVSVELDVAPDALDLLLYTSYEFKQPSIISGEGLALVESTVQKALQELCQERWTGQTIMLVCEVLMKARLERYCADWDFLYMDFRSFSFTFRRIAAGRVSADHVFNDPLPLL